MSGDATLGVVLRELREARELTLAAVARQAGCTEALVSYVESGQRRLHPWLAGKLDRIYRTGRAIVSLAQGTSGKRHEEPASGVPRLDIFVVLLPRGGVAMPLSRREVLTALSIGIVSGELQSEFERALNNIGIDDDLFQSLDDTYGAFKEAARTLPPGQLIDGMTGSVAIIDGLRRRTDGEDRRRYNALQARYAESLSWLSEETGDLSSAMWWIDRAAQWAQAAGWSAMVEYSFVRRSMVVISFSGNGRRAIDQAHYVLDMPDASPRIKGLAAKQMAYGYALAGNRDESSRTLDTAMDWLTQPVREGDILLGQRSVIDDDLFVIFQATCDIYLGHGTHVIPVLEPRLESLSRSSARTATITRAKLARAYANAGLPAEACRLSRETLHVIDQVDSLSARSELRRSMRILDQWHGRSDVQDIVRRLDSRASNN